MTGSEKIFSMFSAFKAGKPLAASKSSPDPVEMREGVAATATAGLAAGLLPPEILLIA
jgi:hypothetical protein